MPTSSCRRLIPVFLTAFLLTATIQAQTLVRVSDETALELRTGVMANIMILPGSGSEDPLTRILSAFLSLYSIRGGAFMEADIPLTGFFRMGPSLGLLYMTQGADMEGNGGTQYFNVPIRLRTTFFYRFLRLTGFAGYDLGGKISPVEFATDGAWDLGGQLGIGPLFAEYDLLFYDSPVGKTFGPIPRVGLGLNFRFR